MHRRKLARKANAPKEDPKTPGKGAVSRFHGIYVGYAVLIRDRAEMSDLFACGSYGKPFYGTAESVPRKRRPKKNVRATGFHIHDALQPAGKRQAVNAPALPVVEEPQEGEDDALSEDEDEDENDAAPAEAEPAAPVPAAAAAAPIDPFPYGNPAHESLQLSLEEAFFLMYGMGVLSVRDESGKELTVLECWRLFVEAQPYFITTYVAYHYYRSHAWCVKSGLKLGVEFVLYKKGPEYFHAEHAVIVLNAEAESKRELPSLHSRTWASVLNVNRVSEQVAKGLLLCYVLQPIDWNPVEALLPECIKRFTVQHLQIRRFVA